jgi:hypothetical protein
VLLPRQQAKLARGAKDKEHAMSQTPNTAIAVIGIDIGKNSFHVVGHRFRSISTKQGCPSHVRFPPDSVAKVVLQEMSKILRAAGAFFV